MAELEDSLIPCLSEESLAQVVTLPPPAVNPFCSRLRLLCGDLLQASPFERAELHLTVAQAIQALFCLYLRAHGTSPEEHAFAKEEVSETNFFDLQGDFSKDHLGSCWVIRAMTLLTGTHQPIQKKSQQGQLRSLTQKVKQSY